jgi:hypothetical protein
MKGRGRIGEGGFLILGGDISLGNRGEADDAHKEDIAEKVAQRAG